MERPILRVLKPNGSIQIHDSIHADRLYMFACEDEKPAVMIQMDQQQLREHIEMCQRFLIEAENRTSKMINEMCKYF